MLPTLLAAEAFWPPDKIEWAQPITTAARREATEKGKPLASRLRDRRLPPLPPHALVTTRSATPPLSKLINDGFVLLKVDANREPRLAQALRIQAYPTMILAGNDGKILGHIEGFIEVGRPSEAAAAGGRASRSLTGLPATYQEATRCKLVEATTWGRSRRLKKIADEVSGPFGPEQGPGDASGNRGQGGRRAQECQGDGGNRPGFGYAAAPEGADHEVCRNPGSRRCPATEPACRTIRNCGPVAKQMLADARKDFTGEHFLECLRKCETLQEAYGSLPEAKDAAFLVKQINDSPEKIALICEALNDQLALKYVGLADLHLGKEQPEFAKVCLEPRQETSNPSSGVLSHVDARLAKIKEKIPGMSTSFPKPN